VPLFPGAVGSALDSGLDDSASPTPWNYVKCTLLNYLLPAYAARRGGLRWNYHLQGVSNAPASLSITREGEGLGFFSTLNIPVDWTDSEFNVAAQNCNDLFPNTWCATHVTDVRNNPVIEAELPYYYPARFYSCRDTNMTGAGRLSTAYHQLTAYVYCLQEQDIPVMTSYVSIAEDFNLYFFCGVPPLFLVNEPDATVL